ncbi:FIG00855465: hypothetical protein [hydrothermal vent metagenome]|uniref:Uncharacterized protein n=1 Tax=hydrothermal vent metagenome TaxID=652676 RepID=A0A3B0RLJ9_9ZZZZ
MSYLTSRLESAAKHLLTPRGFLIVLASAGTAGAVLLSGSGSLGAAIVATVALLTVLLLLNARQSEDHALITNLRQRHKRLARALETWQPTAVQTEQALADAERLRADQLGLIRTTILQVRGTLPNDRWEQQGDTATPPQPTLMTGSDPDVTIVVPCYNEVRFLAETLESVSQQSYTRWECIIVDDASTDASVSEAMAFVRADDRFKLIRHKVNGGLSAARNTGLRLARGRFITFLDSDDLLMSDSIIDRLEAITGHDPDVAGTFCGVRLAPENVSLDTLQPHEEWGHGHFVDFVSASAECPFNAHAPLVRTDVARRVGGFNESMRDGAEDWEFWLRILRRGYCFLPSKWQTAIYRQKNHSMAKTGARRHVLEAQRLIARSYETDSSLKDVSITGHPFPLPLPVYQQQLILARRTLMYAAMSMVRGDNESATAILDRGDVEPWMREHINFDSTINAGIRRAFGLTPHDIRELNDTLQPIRDHLKSLIEVGAPPPPPMDSTQGPRFDVLFAPQDAVQARAMLAGADSLPPNYRAAFVNVERVSGAQGVTPLLNETPYPAFSINEWVLSSCGHKTLIVAFPRSGAIEELIAATTAAGGRAAEITMNGFEAMRLDEKRPSQDLEMIAQSDLTPWLETETEGAVSSPTPNHTRSVSGWAGITSPDPDAAFTVEEYPESLFDGADMERFQDIHVGERCVIIGNGPSLNQLDLGKLESEFTIAVNGIFYAADDMGFDPTYYVVEDSSVMSENTRAIKAYSAGHKFFPSIYRDYIGDDPSVSYFMMNRGFYAQESPSFCVPRFSTDAAQRLYSGQSVTIINLQLAYYMGFSEIVLIGMDFSYTVPDDAEVDGAIIHSKGDDPNHFHPDYFGKGKTWKDPKLDRVLANYQLAKTMFEADGRKIINATAGGKLEMFERQSFDKLFG